MNLKPNSNFVSKWDVKNKVKRERLARAFQREMVFATLSISSGVWWPGNHPDRILGSQSRDCLYSCVQALLKQQVEPLKSCYENYRAQRPLFTQANSSCIVVVTRAMHNVILRITTSDDKIDWNSTCVTTHSKALELIHTQIKPHVNIRWRVRSLTREMNIHCSGYRNYARAVRLRKQWPSRS